MSIRDFLKQQDNVIEIEQGQVDDNLSDLQELFFEFINASVDIDQLNEEQADILDEILELTEDDDNKDENIEDEVSEVAGHRKKVVRGGKRKKKISCPPGYKSQNGRCTRMSAQEKRTRSRSQKRASRKRKSGQRQAVRKRQRSIRKRV